MRDGDGNRRCKSVVQTLVVQSLAVDVEMLSATDGLGNSSPGQKKSLESFLEIERCKCGNGTALAATSELGAKPDRQPRSSH